jgi:hypothetical protein
MGTVLGHYFHRVDERQNANTSGKDTPSCEVVRIRGIDGDKAEHHTGQAR